LPRASIFTPGYFCSFSNGSGGHSLLRVSSHRPKRSERATWDFTKQGSLTKPRYFQRVSRLRCLTLGCDERIFKKSTAPNILFQKKSQKRSWPPVQTIQLLRPLTSLGASCIPPSMSLK